jgi:hypothetical protein
MVPKLKRNLKSPGQRNQRQVLTSVIRDYSHVHPTGFYLRRLLKTMKMSRRRRSLRNHAKSLSLKPKLLLKSVRPRKRLIITSLFLFNAF